MSIDLIESDRRTGKSLGGTFISIAVHASVITLAVYATANAGVVTVKVPVDTVRIVYPASTPDPKPEPSPLVRSPLRSDPTPQSPRVPVIKVPSDVPDQLPTIDPGTHPIPVETYFTMRSPTYSGQGATGSNGSDAGAPMFASQVEKPAAPRAGNLFPKYPTMLESSRVEGTVLAQFVVDTAGVADMRTFKVLESSNELFSESLRATLSKWRFFPAEAGGRKVNQIVHLPLKFTAPRR
ncbi:MAG: TonB family protein [Gemmatimonadota bacterium]